MKLLVLLSLVFAASASQAFYIRAAANSVVCDVTVQQDENGTPTAWDFKINISTDTLLTWQYFDSMSATAAQYWCYGVVEQAKTATNASGYVIIDSSATSESEEALKAEFPVEKSCPQMPIVPSLFKP